MMKKLLSMFALVAALGLGFTANTYADDAEALHEFIAVNWAEWVEEKK